ncbi:MAG TPA: HAMP domain-containing sensor histidine kinase [Solirubrobacteraceae bacterium]
MSRALAAAVAITLATAAAMWAADSRHAALVALAILLPLACATVAAAGALARNRARLGGVRRQLAVLAAIAVAQLLLVVGVFAARMFVSTHDAVIAGLLALQTAALALIAARLVGRRILGDLDAITAAVSAIGAGARDVRIERSGGDELGALAQAVEDMAARLGAEERGRAASEAARRDLVAAVSHDLRTPITSLRLLAEAVGDDMVDAETRRLYLERLMTHVRTLSALIDDLFELSRLEAGDIRWSMERVRLDELVAETVQAMRADGQARGVTLQASVPNGLAPARANPEKIQRVLFNLIQNAIRHTPADGSVTVLAEPSEHGVEIEVADTGEGISDGDRERVFEAFFQGAGRAARSDDGSGLGLAISRAIVAAHGGRIWLADAPRGTRIRFSLPAA